MITIRRKKKCKHYHVSGRRCAMPAEEYCNAHKRHPACSECESMKLSFIPPKGW